MGRLSGHLYLYAYNSSKHESSKFSPFEVMFGRRAVRPVGLQHVTTSSWWRMTSMMSSYREWWRREQKGWKHQRKHSHCPKRTDEAVWLQAFQSTCLCSGFSGAKEGLHSQEACWWKLGPEMAWSLQNFMWDIELMEMMGIDLPLTTPYHPQVKI